MKQLREIQFEDEPIVLDEGAVKGEKSMTILVPWIQSDKKNKNGRIYELKLLQREVARIQDSVTKGGFIGTGDHPASGSADIATSSHIVKKVWLDKKGKGWAEMKIIPTPRGKNVMTLIDQGARLGVSARGYGNVDKESGKVQDDYRLAGIDIVTRPSYEEGVFNKDNVFESLDFEAGENKLEGTKESSLKEEMDSENKLLGEKEEMTLKELKEKFPELVTEIEEESQKGLKKNVEELTAKLKEVEENATKLTTDSEEAVKVAVEAAKKEVNDQRIGELRTVLTAISELDGVIPEGEEEVKTEDETSEKLKEAKKALAEAEKKVTDLEQEKKDKKLAEEAAKVEAEKQKTLKTKLDEELAKDEYKLYKSLIEAKLVDESGKVLIEDVEKVSERVKELHGEFSKVAAIAEKARIESSGLREKGHIENPEGGDEKKLVLKEKKALFQEAKLAGYRGTYKEWEKDKYPLICETK